jgi:hypothetical protein
MIYSTVEIGYISALEMKTYVYTTCDGTAIVTRIWLLSSLKGTVEITYISVF